MTRGEFNKVLKEHLNQDLLPVVTQIEKLIAIYDGTPAEKKPEKETKSGKKRNPKVERADRDKIRQLIVAGKSNQEIIAEFLEKYPTIGQLVKNQRYTRKDWDKTQPTE